MPETLLTDLPDVDLVEAARQGSRPAFDVLVERHAEHAWRLAALVLRNGPAAEEVLRESVLASWRTLPAYSGDPGFGTWLDRTALTRSLRVLERTGEARQLPTAGVAAPELALLPPQELADRVLECRNRLPGGLRAVLVLLDAEGRPLPEVEVLLGAPQSALRQRLWRARFALWRCLTGRVDPTKEEAAAQDMLCAYLDGELSGASERAAFERKLEAQPALTALARDLGTLRRLVAEEVAPPLPSGLVAKIIEQLPPGDVVPALRPRVPRATDERSFAERLAHGPALRAVAIIAIVAAMAGGGWAVIRSHAGEGGFWSRLRGSGAQAQVAAPQETAPAVQVPEPGPPVTASAPSPPQAGPERERVEPRETEVQAPPRTEARPVSTPESAPEPAQEPVREPAPQPADADQDATALASGECSNTWLLPGGPFRWMGTPPEDPARVLGGLAQELGGKGLLLNDHDPRVKLTVPSARWAELSGALLARGIALQSATPPGWADCASLVVAIPASL